jgi:cyclase
MRRTTGWLLAGVLVAGALGAPAQQDFSKVEVKAEKVKGNVYMLTGAGGNIGVSAGPDGVLIVDDQFAPLAGKIRAALAGISSGKLKFILNTHFHGDHTGGNKEFGPEAPIIAQTNVRKRLMTDQTRGGRTTPAAPKEAWPVVTFDHSVSIHFNGEEIKAIHFPQGHTDGDSVIFFTGSNVVHMGDDFFAGRFPFVDLDAGGNVDGLIKNIAELISQIPADAAIIPGHGPVSTVEDLKAYHQMLVETSTIVANKMKAGQSLDAIRAEGLGDQWASWGTGFINTHAWIEAIYKSKSF